MKDNGLWYNTGPFELKYQLIFMKEAVGCFLPVEFSVPGVKTHS